MLKCDFLYYCNDQLNYQAMLYHIKSYLAWALHFAAGQAFNLLQTEKGTREEKIRAFNQHFSTLLQAHDDGTITDIAFVYEKIDKLTLHEITDFVNHLLLTKCDIQKKLVENINKVAALLKAKNNFDTLPFQAWERWHRTNKYPPSISRTAGFAFNRLTEEYDKKIKNGILIVRKRLAQDEEYEFLNDISFSEEETSIENMLDQFSKCERKINDYKNFHEYKKVIERTKTQIMLSNERIAQLEATMLHHYKTIASSAYQAPPLFHLPAYIQNVDCYVNNQLAELYNIEGELQSFVALSTDTLARKKQMTVLQTYVKRIEAIDKTLQKTYDELEKKANEIKYQHFVFKKKRQARLLAFNTKVQQILQEIKVKSLQPVVAETQPLLEKPSMPSAEPAPIKQDTCKPNFITYHKRKICLGFLIILLLSSALCCYVTLCTASIVTMSMVQTTNRFIAMIAACNIVATIGMLISSLRKNPAQKESKMSVNDFSKLAAFNDKDIFTALSQIACLPTQRRSPKGEETNSPSPPMFFVGGEGRGEEVFTIFSNKPPLPNPLLQQKTLEERENLISSP